MKFVREGSRPVSGDSGLVEIRELAEKDEFEAAAQPGKMHVLDTDRAYVEHLLSYVDVASLKPLKIVVDAGNGGAGRVVDLLEEHLPFEFIKLHHEPDGNFPNGVPNPLLPENRTAAIEAVRANNADLGIGWDGDFDRCFFFDETGEFIEGYYLVGLLGEAFLRREAGAKIVHDPRLTWNTIEMVKAAGGQPVLTKCGHAFIKERMRLENAAYGGEMSAHHYFRDFAYCDSGMIPWLLVTGLISSTGKPLSNMVKERMAAYPCSGEINRSVDDAKAVLAKAEAAYGGQGEVDHIDGISVDLGNWRFNLRMSNTEPVVRLNVESRGDKALMEAKTAELLALIEEQ
jgi:phosphomannomutase